MSCLLDFLVSCFRFKNSIHPLPPEATSNTPVHTPVTHTHIRNNPQSTPAQAEMTCPICLEPIGRRSPSTTLVCKNRPCKTYYHKSCFQAWQQRRGDNTPTCLICTLPQVKQYRKKRKNNRCRSRIIHVRPRPQNPFY